MKDDLIGGSDDVFDDGSKEEVLGDGPGIEMTNGRYGIS